MVPKWMPNHPIQAAVCFLFVLAPWLIMAAELIFVQPIILNSSNAINTSEFQIDENVIYKNVTVERIVYRDSNDLQDGNAIHLSERKPQKRTIIAVEVAKTRKSPREFLTMLYASWSFARSRWDIDSIVRSDIWVACEVGTCEYLPVDCVEYTGVEYIKTAQAPICVFNRLPDDYVSKWRRLNYLFMTSLEFAGMEPFVSIVPFYDYVLRADVDCFVTPSINTWIPEHPSAIGFGYLGSGWTSARLTKMATKYNLTHRGVHHFQSTWYIQADKFVELIRLTVDVVQKLLEYEFTRDICEDLRKENKGQKRCGWPDWHRGVASLYASELALNHVFPDLNASWKSKKLDVAVTQKGRRTRDVVCAHNIHTGLKDGRWHKFPFHAMFKGGWSTICHQRVKDEYNATKGIQEDGMLNDFCRDVAWSAVHTACGFQNVRRRL